LKNPNNFSSSPTQKIHGTPSKSDIKHNEIRQNPSMLPKKSLNLSAKINNTRNFTLIKKKTEAKERNFT